MSLSPSAKKNSQIDLLIDRKDETINVCEMNIAKERMNFSWSKKTPTPKEVGEPKKQMLMKKLYLITVTRLVTMPLSVAIRTI